MNIRLIQTFLLPFLLFFATSILSCENRGHIETSKENIVEITTKPAVKFAWTPSGLAKSYHSDGINIMNKGRTLWSYGALNVTAGAFQQSLKPKIIKPTISTNNILWNVEFSLLKVVIPVRITSASGIHLCRVAMNTPKLSLKTTIKIEKTPPKNRYHFKNVAAPTITYSNWSSTIIGECDTSSFPTVFNFEQALNDYINDSFVISLANAFEKFPAGPFDILSGTKKISSISNYESRRGAIYVTPDFDNLQIQLHTDGVEITFPVKLGNNRASCAPLLDLSTVKLSSTTLTEKPLDFAKTENGDFAATISSEFLRLMMAAFIRSGLSCTGFEQRTPNLKENDVVNTESLELNKIGIVGLPFSELSTLLFIPTSFPEISFNPSAKQFRLSFPSAKIDVYTGIYGIESRLASIAFSVSFDIQLTAKRNVVYQKILKTEIRNAKMTSTIGVSVLPEKLAQWLQRMFVLALSNDVKSPSALFSSPDFAWKSVILKTNSLSLVGDISSGSF